jgi:hypothetical protein
MAVLTERLILYQIGKKREFQVNKLLETVRSQIRTAKTR